MAKKTEGTPAKVDVKKESTEVIILDQFQETKKELTKLVSGYKDLVVNEETYDEAKKALATIRASRYSIQNQAKNNDANRIAWNKKFAASNKEKEKELLDILTPVEDPIAEKLKEIESVWQKEKEEKAAAAQALLDARIKQITDTGAVIAEGGYLLGDQFISHQEIQLLPETQFMKCVNIFVATAAEITEKAEEETLRAQKEEEERKALLQRTTDRKSLLFGLGMTAGQTAFVYSADVKPFTFIDIESLPDDKFNLRLENYKTAIAHEKDIIAKEKEKQDQIAADNAAQQRKNEEAAAELARQAEEIKQQKESLHKQKTENRTWQLINLGMKEVSDGFRYNGKKLFAEALYEDLWNKEEGEWTSIIQSLTAEIAKIKTEDSRIAEEQRLQLQYEARVKELVSKGFYEHEGCYTLRDCGTIPPTWIKEYDHNQWKALMKEYDIKSESLKEIERQKFIPDSEKLLAFANTFNKPFALELKTDQAKKILADFNLKVINSVQELIIELNKINK